MRGGGGGAHPTAIVYEPALTVDLPPETTVGTAMNALAHCAEALYAQGHNPAADEDALAGAALIAEWLPRVVAAPADLHARTELLRGASHGGAALAGSMLALAHAMAQAVGGAYGLPHGTLNGIVLAPVAPVQRGDRSRRGAPLRRGDRRAGRPRRASRGADSARRPDPPERARRAGTRSPRSRRRRGRTWRQPREPEAGEPGGDRAAASFGALGR